MSSPDIIIIGAGVAGVSAAIDLSRAGLTVAVLEARNRIGGRVFPIRDSESNEPIELGAEFIHGLPPEIWLPLQEHKIPVAEVEGDNWCVRAGNLCSCDFFGDVDDILKKMDDRPRDRSFIQFLERNFPNPNGDPKLEEIKAHARGYVTGFNAADPIKVSVNWLVEGMRAEEQVEGERAFRIADGYGKFLDILRQQFNDGDISLNLNHVVQSIKWSKGKVQVIGRAGKPQFTLHSPRLLVTLPLGVLLASSKERGAVHFSPGLPSSKQQALDKLAMGHVIRVNLQFRERFWDKLHPPDDKSKTLSKLSFLFSDDQFFPTWWTRMPFQSAVITGWAPFKAADRLSGKNARFVADQALATLSKLLKLRKTEIEKLLLKAHFHDWQSDPFSRGAYSYVKVGGKHSPERLGRPVDKTIFFAGEATDVTGHIGTVHGAIASGKRAAKEILTS